MKVRVYAEAEKVRQRWLAKNIALEDVIAQFLETGASRGICFEIDASQAEAALLGSGPTLGATPCSVDSKRASDEAIDGIQILRPW